MLLRRCGRCAGSALAGPLQSCWEAQVEQLKLQNLAYGLVFVPGGCSLSPIKDDNSIEQATDCERI